MKKFFKINILVVLAFFLWLVKKKDEVKVEENIVKSVFAINPILKDESQNRVFNASASSNHQIKLSFKVKRKS